MRTPTKVSVAATLDHPTRGEIDVVACCSVAPGWSGSYYDPPEGPEVVIESIETDAEKPEPIDTAFLDNCADPKDRYYKAWRSIEEAAIDLATEDDGGPEHDDDY